MARGEMLNFGAFWNFTGVRFATFSVLTGVSFGENEISTDVRFRAFFLEAKTDKGRRKKKNSRLRGVSFASPPNFQFSIPFNSFLARGQF